MPSIIPDADAFKQGASKTLGKPIGEVTLEERMRFKRAVFNLLLPTSPFMQMQPDYIQKSHARYREDIEHMEDMCNIVCPQCFRNLSPSSANEENFIFWCEQCDKEVEVERV